MTSVLAGLWCHWLTGLLFVLATVGCTTDPPAPPDQQPSILLLTVGGWSAGAVSAVATDAELDWRGSAVVSSSDPLASLASIHTGVGVWHHQLLASSMAVERTEIPTLAERLTQLGYETVAVVPRPLRRRHLLTEGFSRIENPASVQRTAVEGLVAAEVPTFLWLHLAGPSGAQRRHGGRARDAWAERIARQLEELRESLRTAPRPVIVVAVGSHGWSEADTPRMDRTALEVPLVVGLTPALRTRLAAEPGQRISAARLWATLIEAAGGKVEPGRAPSLFHRLAEPILSELYFSGGSNYFSLLDGDLQLRWVVRYASAPAAGGSSRTARQRKDFLDTLPLYGAAADPPRQFLERWRADGSEPFDDPSRRQQLADELERMWLRYTNPRQTPRDVIRETQRRSNRAQTERGAEAFH